MYGTKVTRNLLTKINGFRECIDNIRGDKDDGY